MLSKAWGHEPFGLASNHGSILLHHLCLHVQVVTGGSSFGRVGSWLAKGWHHSYILGGESKRCGLQDYSPYEADATAWAGYR